MALSEATRARISDIVSQHRVVLFMKGTRQAPQCGFSGQVVQILDELLPSYETVNVLASPELREGIKEFSQWPTIPQLFIDGELVGGADIVRELGASGELPKILGVEVANVPIPRVSISEAARAAFEAALSGAGEERLHLAIDAGFVHDLYVGPRAAGEVEAETNGPVLLLDRASARRADGLKIDFVSGPNSGFKLDNPNEPPKVRQLTPRELVARRHSEQIVLFDVRPEAERALAAIEWARPLDEAGQDYLFGLDKTTPIAFLCHHGIRSRDAAQQLLDEGFSRVYNVEGGIDAWSQTVDPSIPRY